MDDELFSYLIATDQVDEFMGYKPKCPICEESLIKLEENYYCEKCDKLFNSNTEEIKNYIK